ncbi:hypothetical protein J4447_05050 [Candidatus Pacearchaeota archaeon]|nr:hypothetical protein [Candidatus Aenigmarchaeota archaeon]MBS3074787.1 hypothetical protein [Candidatus Pacearchaeota archaeon]
MAWKKEYYVGGKYGEHLRRADPSGETYWSFQNPEERAPLTEKSVRDLSSRSVGDLVRKASEVAVHKSRAEQENSRAFRGGDAEGYLTSSKVIAAYREGMQNVVEEINKRTGGKIYE